MFKTDKNNCQFNNKWISINDKLPALINENKGIIKTSERVLLKCVDKSDDILYAIGWMFNYNSEKSNTYWASDHECVGTYYKIIEWKHII